MSQSIRSILSIISVEDTGCKWKMKKFLNYFYEKYVWFILPTYFKWGSKPKSVNNFLRKSNERWLLLMSLGLYERMSTSK